MSIFIYLYFKRKLDTSFKKIGVRHHVNDNFNYGYNFENELNKKYQFEISQERNSDGEANYRIKIDGKIEHEIINTTPKKFKNMKLYLSDRFYPSFGQFGKISKLKIWPNSNFKHQTRDPSKVLTEKMKVFISAP